MNVEDTFYEEWLAELYAQSVKTTSIASAVEDLVSITLNGEAIHGNKH